MIETCGGFCCERFRIRTNFYTDASMSLGEVTKLAKKAFDSKDDPQNFQMVADMLISLGYSKTNGNGREDDKESYWFTCKNFDTTTRLCKVYEQRPPMCRNCTPGPCGYEKCQLKVVHKEDVFLKEDDSLEVP